MVQRYDNVPYEKLSTYPVSKWRFMKTGILSSCGVNILLAWTAWGFQSIGLFL